MENYETKPDNGSQQRSDSEVKPVATIQPSQADESSLETLEVPTTSDNPDQTAVASGSENTVATPLIKPPKSPGRKNLFSRFNPYLVLFIFLLVITAAVILIAFVVNKRNNAVKINTQTLTDDTLKQLANSDVTVGEPKQVLNVQSNAVFAGKVLIRDSLEVAGPIQVGGNLSIPGITVSGNSIFDQVQINKTLSVAGDAALQGQLSVQKSLSVAGGATFGGALSAPQITANTLQLNGDLNLTHHITAGGATPGRTNGGSLGSGGTTSVSGSDTAGSVNINTGAGAAAGCFITVNFTQRYNSTPHVIVSPVGSAAGGLGYYVNRSTSSFSICSSTTPPSFASFGFDYFVLD